MIERLRTIGLFRTKETKKAISENQHVPSEEERKKQAKISELGIKLQKVQEKIALLQEYVDRVAYAIDPHYGLPEPERRVAQSSNKQRLVELTYELGRPQYPKADLALLENEERNLVAEINSLKS